MSEKGNEIRVKSKKYQGVYYRDSSDPTRVHNGKPDRVFSYTYRDENGVKRWPTAGWLSEGASEQYAHNCRLEMLRKVSEKKSKTKLTADDPHPSAAQIPESAPIVQAAISPTNGSVEIPTPSEPEFLFDELAERYFIWMKGEGKYADKERSRYNTTVKDSIGWVPYSCIDILIARDLKADLFSRMSAKSAKDSLSLCRTIFNHSRESGYIKTVNPFGRESGFKMPRVQNKCERYLEPSEVAVFFPELKRRSPNVWAMSLLSLRTGLRSTEIFRIKGGDLVPAAGFIWITAKGGSRQKVFCDKEVMELLLSFKRGRNEYVFHTNTGEPLKEIPDVFRRTAEDLGLTPQTTRVVDGKEVRIKRTQEQKQEDQRKKVWFHTLRHTYASWLAQSARVTLHELRDLMRHASIEQTERYAHMMPNNSQKEHSNAISDIWGKFEAEQKQTPQSEDKFKLQALEMIQDQEFQAALEAIGPSATTQGADVLLSLLKSKVAKAV